MSFASSNCVDHELIKCCSSQTVKLIQGIMMKWTLSFWGLHLESPILCRPMFTSEEVGMEKLLEERWSFICGLILPKIFITMLYYGVPRRSCKYFFGNNHGLVPSYIYIYIFFLFFFFQNDNMLLYLKLNSLKRNMCRKIDKLFIYIAFELWWNS